MHFFFFFKKKKQSHPRGKIVFVHPHEQNSRHQARLLVFEDNDAVIKKIIKGRSLDDETRLRQTHRVALDWLCDMINFSPGIQIKHVNTARQTADIVTKVMSGTDCLDCLTKKDRATLSFSHLRSFRLQFDESMRMLQAQLEGESRSVAEWRPVRNPCAYNTHSTSSSSGSNVNSLFVQAWKKS